MKKQSISNPYEKVKIGSQVWMKINLDRDSFNNGDKIQYVKSLEELQNANKKNTPAWCYYGFEEKNGLTFGKLYNFYAINDKRGLAPEGFKMVKTLRHRLEKKWNHSKEDSLKRVIHFDIQKTEELINGNWSENSCHEFGSNNHQTITKVGLRLKTVVNI